MADGLDLHAGGATSLPMKTIALITATALTVLAGPYLAQATDAKLLLAQAQPAEPAEPSRLQRAWDSLKDATDLAGDAAREEAIRLRQRAQEAIDNSGPLVDRAGQLAAQLRDRLADTAEQAARDLSAAADDLEQRIRDARGTPVAPPSNPEATLPPLDRLNTDTRAAASPRPAGTVPDYVGAWAQTPAACAQIDQNGAADFAVITPTTIRQADSVCNMASPTLTNGTATAQASCYAEGNEGPREIILNLTSPDSLRISSGASVGRGQELVRCHLPD